MQCRFVVVRGPAFPGGRSRAWAAFGCPKPSGSEDVAGSAAPGCGGLWGLAELRSSLDSRTDRPVRLNGCRKLLETLTVLLVRLIDPDPVLVPNGIHLPEVLDRDPHDLVSTPSGTAWAPQDFLRYWHELTVGIPVS